MLQKSAYLTVLAIVFPALFLTGLTMSPAVTAAAPWLFTLFGGRQSARTLHFIFGVILVLFRRRPRDDGAAVRHPPDAVADDHGTRLVTP